MSATLLIALYFARFVSEATACPGHDLIITGVLDGPLSGGLPKLIELYVINDIPDLSIYGLSAANNGAPSNGVPDIRPVLSGSISQGEYMYITKTYRGDDKTDAFFDPDLANKFSSGYSASAANINGDDAVELYKKVAGDWTVVDVFGEVGTDGTGQRWEYMDGWAYRKSGTCPTLDFNLDDWAFSGKNKLDGAGTNAAAGPFMFPIGTFHTEVQCPGPGKSRRCRMQTDPHITSWDGQGYDYHDLGLHPVAVLDHPVPSCAVPAFSVEGSDYRCTFWGATCVNKIVFKVDAWDLTVTLLRSKEFSIVGDADAHGVSVVKSGLGLILQTSFGLTIKHNVWYLDLEMDACLAGCTVEQVCGVCGMHNFIYGDDYSNTDSKCHISQYPEIPECPSPSAQTEAEEKCGVIIHPTGPFADCHLLPGIDDDFEFCVIDYCEGSGLICTTLNLLQDKCIAAGYAVGDWYTNLNCNRTCGEPGAIWYPADSNCRTVCQCSEIGQENCWDAPGNWCPEGASCRQADDGALACFMDPPYEGCKGPSGEYWHAKWTCCNQRIYPRYDGNNNTLIRTNNCCNNYAILGSDFLCCRGRDDYLMFTRRFNGVDNLDQCCGPVPYKASEKDCCNGQLMANGSC